MDDSTLEDYFDTIPGWCSGFDPEPLQIMRDFIAFGAGLGPLPLRKSMKVTIGGAWDWWTPGIKEPTEYTPTGAIWEEHRQFLYALWKGRHSKDAWMAKWYQIHGEEFVEVEE